MPLASLAIPPGVMRIGTEYQSTGRWHDASLVRWADGAMGPIGGWAERYTIATNKPVRGSIAWFDNNRDRWIAAGTYDRLYSVSVSGTLRDITPGGLAEGYASEQANLGYGGGFYGIGFYGTPRPDTGTQAEATTWALDTWGENLVACSVEDGRIWEWNLDTVTGSDVVTNGTFAVDANWTKGTGWTISGGVGSFSGSTIAALSQVLTVVNGDTYELVFTLANASAGEARAVVTGTGELFNQTFASGTYTVRFRANATSVALKFEPAAAVASAFTVDNVSATKVPAARLIANAPVSNDAIIVTEERFLFALGAGGNPRKVQWSDRENNTVWAPSATNQAGDIELQTGGRIMLGIKARGQALILTNLDAHTATYTGGQFVYGFERVGTACGAVSRRCAAGVDMGVFWMGARGFYLFSGGQVQEVPCEVSDFVFNDTNNAQKSKVHAVANAEFNEVWWFYPSRESTECNRYVSFNYAENHWSIGEIDRTSGIDRGAFNNPIWFSSNGKAYNHESGANLNGYLAYAQSGPFEMGETVMAATMLVPDEKTRGQVSATFKTRFYPNGDETTHGPYSLEAPTDVRFTGRQVAMRVVGEPNTAWRWGQPRLDVRAGGRR
jgi:hypothetical protein